MKNANFRFNRISLGSEMSEAFSEVSSHDVSFLNNQDYRSQKIGALFVLFQLKGFPIKLVSS